MRKRSALILLFAFMLAQYARHINYLQCLAGGIILPYTQCDCAKVFSTDNQPKEDTANVPQHRHIHLEETYAFQISSTKAQSPVHYILKHKPAYNAKLTAGVKDEPEHPPQML